MSRRLLITQLGSIAEALKTALEIDLLIEGGGSADKARFMEVARREGLRAVMPGATPATRTQALSYVDRSNNAA